MISSLLNCKRMMVLTDNTSKLEIDLASWNGDAYLTVKLDSRGYAGENDLHILGEDFRSFCKKIRKLQSSLKGEAVLNSISPNELQIVIKSFDSLGHMSVTGKIGYHIYTLHSCNWHSVEFGFEIDPQELDKAAKVDWVKKYAI